MQITYSLERDDYEKLSYESISQMRDFENTVDLFILNIGFLALYLSLIYLAGSAFHAIAIGAGIVAIGSLVRQRLKKFISKKLVEYMLAQPGVNEKEQIILEDRVIRKESNEGVLAISWELVSKVHFAELQDMIYVYYYNNERFAAIPGRFFKSEAEKDEFLEYAQSRHEQYKSKQ